jgi:hypothetical protein
MTVWIGTKNNPFANHVELSDSVLSSLGYVEENFTTSGDSRWADVDSGARTGNYIVIAALASDTSAEDEFKLGKLDIACK